MRLTELPRRSSCPRKKQHGSSENTFQWTYRKGTRGTTTLPDGSHFGPVPFPHHADGLQDRVGSMLAVGNAVVEKPATDIPLSSVAFFECLDEAAIEVGEPDGIINVVISSGSTVGDALLDHDDAEAISFRGSAPVGKYLADNSGMKKITLELGGNDPIIVWHGTNLRSTAEQAVVGARANGSQVCNRVNDVLVEERIEDKFISEVSTTHPASRSGVHTTRTSTSDRWSPTTNSRALSTYLKRDFSRGNPGDRVLEPTVLSDITPDMPAATEQISGVIIPVISVSDFSEAIEEASNTSYHLEAGVFTQDTDRSRRAAD